MALVHRVEFRGRMYQVADDLTSVYGALIVGGVVDELTELAPPVRVRVEPDRRGLTGRGLDGGLFAAAGDAAAAFPVLQPPGETVRLTLTAPGYAAAVAEALVAPGTTFPVRLAPVVLRRRPVSLRGLLTVSELDHTPVAGRRVRVLDGPAARVIALRTPTALDHPAAVVVRARAVTTVAATSLAAPARAGATSVVVDSVSGLMPPAVVTALALGTPSELAYAVVAGFDPAARSVALRAPLVRPLAAGTPAVGVSFATPPVPSSAPLKRAADAGDGLLVTTAALVGDTVEIADAGPGYDRTEYHELDAVTDADGVYRFEGVTGAAALDLQPAPPPTTPSIRTVHIDYSAGVNVVDLVTKP